MVSCRTETQPETLEVPRFSSPPREDVQRSGKVAKVKYNIEVTWKAIAGSHTWLAGLGLAEVFQMAMPAECLVS